MGGIGAHARTTPTWSSSAATRDGAKGSCSRIWTPLPLDLHDPESVLAWVDDPCRQGEPEVSNTVFSLQAGEVIVFDLDPTGTEFRNLGTDVWHLPRGLGLLVSSPNRARGHLQMSSATALELDGGIILVQNLEAELFVVEIPGCGKVLGQEHRRDRMVTEHRTFSLVPGPRTESRPARGGVNRLQQKTNPRCGSSL